MSRMRDQRKHQKVPKRRMDKTPSQTLEIDERDIVEELELDDLDRRSLELES